MNNENPNTNCQDYSRPHLVGIGSLSLSPMWLAKEEASLNFKYKEKAMIL